MTYQKRVVAFVGVVVGLALTMGGCPTPASDPASGLTGDAAAGQTKFAQSCVQCHSASSLRGSTNRIVTNLGSVSGAMNGITLTAQQVADLRAYVTSQ